MSRAGKLGEWYRFLDARSDEEAVAEVRRHMARLEDVYGGLDWEARQLASCPGEVDQILRVARASVGEAIELLDDLASRFRASSVAVGSRRGGGCAGPQASPAGLRAGCWCWWRCCG
jgi:hypothetical protein